MKLGVTMVFALVIAFFAAHSFTSLFEQDNNSLLGDQ